MIVAAIVLLAGAGLVISSYFTAVAYRWMAPDAPWIPRLCRMEERTCATIVFTPRARVFGLPNSLLGQVYYVALIAAAVSGGLFEPPAFHVYLAASLLTVGLGAFLTYSLLYLTRVRCVLCLASHGLNLAIFVLLVAGR